MFPVVENILKTDRHKTFYLAFGVEDAPLMIFVHGWPGLAVRWRHQLPCFGDLGFRAVAPDTPGYSRSSVYARHVDHAPEPSVADMDELVCELGGEELWTRMRRRGPILTRVWQLSRGTVSSAGTPVTATARPASSSRARPCMAAS